MKPEPLASSGVSDGARSSKPRSRSSMLGGRFWPPPPGERRSRGVGRVRAKRSVSIETTAGRAWSATASKADSRSAAGATSAAVGLVAEPFTLPWGHPKRVRLNPDAKTSPQTNATTIAAPKRAREYLAMDASHLLLEDVL